MTINTNFPCKICESCNECILRADTKTLYGDDRVVTRVINVSCEHATLCKRLEEQINEQKTSSDPID